MRKWHFLVAEKPRSQSSNYLISPLSNCFPWCDFYNLKKTRGKTAGHWWLACKLLICWFQQPSINYLKGSINCTLDKRHIFQHFFPKLELNQHLANKLITNLSLLLPPTPSSFTLSCSYFKRKKKKSSWVLHPPVASWILSLSLPFISKGFSYRYCNLANAPSLYSHWALKVIKDFTTNPKGPLPGSALFTTVQRLICDSFLSNTLLVLSVSLTFWGGWR